VRCGKLMKSTSQGVSADEIACAPCALMPGLLYFHRAMSQFLPL
jgi:hypothetical protein